MAPETEQSNSINDRNFIINLVKGKDNKLSFVPQSGKSEAWIKFERIFYDNVETNFVKCKYCDDIQKHTTSGGTGGLLRHNCRQNISFDRKIAIQSNNKFINYSTEQMSQEFHNKTLNELMVTESDDLVVNDRNFYINLVKSRDNKLSFAPQKGKSKVWNRFERIFYDNIETLYVKCKYCDDIQKNTTSGGTGGLLRHKCIVDSQERLNFNYTNDSDCREVSNKSIGLEMSESELVNDRNYFINLVRAKDSRLSFVAEKGKSEVWNRFERIFYDNCETLYVKCKYCDDIQKHTTSGGTGGLLRHRCKSYLDNCKTFDENKKFKSKSRLKKSSISEKLLIRKLSQENKVLKVIVKKCLKMIDKCLCFNKYNSEERKDINVLINRYNKWLFEFKDYDDLDPYNEQISDETMDQLDSEKNIRSDVEQCSLSEREDSDKDSEYKPYSEEKKTNLKLNSIRNVNKLQIIRNNSLKQKLSNAIKRKYEKNIHKQRDTNQRLVCEWPGCEKVFRLNQHLKEHRDGVHLEIKRYRCDWPGCDDAFLKKSQLNAHISKYHTNEKPIKCDQCSYQTLYKALLLRHQRIHGPEKPCVCDWPGCEFKTNFEQGLRTHKLRHSGAKPYKCSWPQCEWSFRQSHHLKAHMLKHTGEKPVVCQFSGCDRRFSSRQAMRFHCEKVHKS